MNIFVCIKQVPDTEARIEVKTDKTGVTETGFKWIMNPYDEFAVEAAVKIKEAIPAAKIVAITVGPKARVQEILRTALALGVDEAIVVDSAEALDFSMTANALFKAIKAEGGADLVLTGKLAIDDNGSAVGPMLAALLNIPHASSVTKLELNATKSATIERELEGGSKEVLEIPFPCLIGATKGLNTPRYASLPNIMKAKKKPLKELTGTEFINAGDRKIRFVDYTPPHTKAQVKMLAGEPQQQVLDLVGLLKNEAKVL